MINVLLSIVLGIIIGKYLNKKILKLNDYMFTILSTLFVFLMGISLGLSRTIFFQAQSIIINALVLSLVLSLGSILSVFIYTKFIIKSNV